MRWFSHLYPEPKETLEDLETILNDASEKLKALQKPKSASEYTGDDDDDLFFDLGVARLTSAVLSKISSGRSI